MTITYSLDLNLPTKKARKLANGGCIQLTHKEIQSGEGGIPSTLHLTKTHYHKLLKSSSNGKGCRINPEKHLVGNGIHFHEDNNHDHEDTSTQADDDVEPSPIVVKNAVVKAGRKAIDKKAETKGGFINKQMVEKAKRVLKPVLDVAAPAVLDTATSGLKKVAKKAIKGIAEKMGVNNPLVEHGINEGVDAIADKGRNAVKDLTGYGITNKKPRGRPRKNKEGEGFSFNDFLNGVSSVAKTAGDVADTVGKVAPMMSAAAGLEGSGMKKNKNKKTTNGKGMKKKMTRNGKGVLGDIGQTVDGIFGGIGMSAFDPNEKLQHANADVRTINENGSIPTGKITKINSSKQGVGSLLTVQQAIAGAHMCERRNKKIKGKGNGLVANPHDKLLTAKTHGGSFRSLGEMS